MDTKKAQKLAKKLSKGQRFDLEDFKMQLSQMESMGGLGSIFDKLPANLRSRVPVEKMDLIDNARFKKMKVILMKMKNY